MRATAEAVSELGYVTMTVAEVLKRAGVSRETFYTQFADKHECSMAAFDRAADEIIANVHAAIEDVTATGGSEEERSALHHQGGGNRTHQSRGRRNHPLAPRLHKGWSGGAEQEKTDFEAFYDQALKLNPSRELITGVVCGVRVEEIEEPLMREIRYRDKMIDELAHGKAMKKNLREA